MNFWQKLIAAILGIFKKKETPVVIPTPVKEPVKPAPVVVKPIDKPVPPIVHPGPVFDFSSALAVSSAFLELSMA